MEFAYGEKVRITLTGGAYHDTFVALTPGGDRAILLGVDEMPYTVPLDVVGKQPNRWVIAGMMSSAVHSELGIAWPGFDSPIQHTIFELLDRYVPELEGWDMPTTSMLNVLEDYHHESLLNMGCAGCAYLSTGCGELFPGAFPCIFVALVEAAFE